MNVKKQNGEFEEFSSNKIKENLKSVAIKCNEIIGDEIINIIINNLFLYDNIESKEIRKQIENSLMSINKKIAKEYIKTFGENDNLKKQGDFIKQYIKSVNASTGSKFDSNANVSRKNIVTMGQELYKEHNIKQNRWILYFKIKSLFSKKLADAYINDLETHVLYKHDETAIPGMPYCVSINMYPFLIDGLTKLGGESVAPTDSKSFTGGFVNLIYSISSQFAGAVATPEYLMYLDYFLRKDYGDDYINNTHKIVDYSTKKRTIEQNIENLFQQVLILNYLIHLQIKKTLFLTSRLFRKNNLKTYMPKNI